MSARSENTCGRLSGAAKSRKKTGGIFRPFLFAMLTSLSPGLPETLAPAYHPGICLLALLVICRFLRRRFVFGFSKA